jgi:hypothetical protein
MSLPVSAVGLAPVLDSIDGYDTGLVINIVEDAIDAYPQAMIFGASKLLGAGWARILC